MPRSEIASPPLAASTLSPPAAAGNLSPLPPPQKKKAKPKAPAYLTDAASLQPFGVQVRRIPCRRRCAAVAAALLPPSAAAHCRDKTRPPHLTSPHPAFHTQGGQLVKTRLGCTAAVLGLKASAEGGQLWVRYASGQEAPLDMARCLGGGQEAAWASSRCGRHQ